MAGPVRDELREATRKRNERNSVERALLAVAVERGGLDDAAARTWHGAMAKAGRYLKDVY